MRSTQLPTATRCGARTGPAPVSRNRTASVCAAVAVQQQQQLQVKDDAQPLFNPLKLGDLELQHRVIMAPLTRCRAPDNVPAPVMATYYGQRASAGGLIISEATAICPEAHGYPQVPGIYTQQQVEAWRPVVQALWHVGRASHPDYQPGNALPVSSSALPIGDGFEVYTPKGGPFKYPTPRALDASEIPAIVKAYADAARNAIAAGFDGVEVHGANGYLLDQFWKDSTNQRSDEYGGSDENKARLLLEVMEAVAAAVGAQRVGLRLSPYNTFLDACDDVQRAVQKNVWLVQELDRRVPGLAYLHMVEPRLAGGNAEVEGPIDHSLEPFRKATKLPFLAAGGFKRNDGIAAVKDGKADAVVYGRYFISNPDLPRRLAEGAELTPYDRDTFYSFGEQGYVDYPCMEESS
ncbi:putative 12-oxophytodienoic acid reductase [Scenedesmus sp. NREL 46B-D3]|nr:putative 12-oxophytodienoic acid reductase [Scenedesmus sp. NREL 46B-D3]